jgi:hypothetical protein
MPTRPNAGLIHHCGYFDCYSVVVPSLGSQANGFLDCAIKVEAGIDAESGTVVEETAAGTFGLRENGIGLRQCEIGKRRREEIAGFRREAPYVFPTSSSLPVYHRFLAGSAKRLSLTSAMTPKADIVRAN